MAVLADSDDLLEILENDLKAKITAVLTSSSISASVHGVFSLDDLEKKTESEMCGGIGIGVGYQGCVPTTNHPAQNNPAPGANVVKTGDFLFVVLLAAPVDQLCTQRITALKLLTLLRSGIIGKQLTLGREQRTWAFVQEKPEVDESTETVLYYTQVWRLVLPIKSK